MEGFLHYQIGGLMHGGAYFRNFTVFHAFQAIPVQKSLEPLQTFYSMMII